MKQIPFLRPIALGIALAATGVAPAHAQTSFVASPTSDADRLAQQMRVLAADPRDVSALLEAGTLSARLGDTSAALAFFARAETLDPSNPRILAGRASALVRMERPGEALRLFQSAEMRGLSPRDYAADRGFAYDLLGQPALAQNDYKLALQWTRDDETVRRYALSLGITGDTEGAMRQLDALLRRSDRAAWRARAFILAMNGDVTGAERIAASMMPGNMGDALAPFFRRLANLSPADRAFAVHFGELSPTTARLADARQAPLLPRYVPTVRPVQLAQAQPRGAAESGNRRDRRSRRDRDGTLAPAVRRAAPLQTAAADPQYEPPLPAPPRTVARNETPLVQPLPAPRADEIEAPVRQVPVRQNSAPVQMASREIAPPVRSAIVPPTQGMAGTASVGDTARIAVATPAPVSLPAAAPPERVPTNVSATPPAEQRIAAATAPVVAASVPQPAVAAAPEPKPPGPARVGQEDTVLASIVAGITIPAKELETVNAAPAEPAPEPERVAAAEAEPVRVVPKPAPVKPVAKSKPETPKPEAAKDKKGAKPEPAKPDPKAKVDPKAAKIDPKATKKPDPKAKDPAKAEPRRIWVQVAGGANEASLAKAWKAAVAKAPAAFKGKSGWWTPLRATNRVLAGPFATTTEAQAFVNAIGKSGISGFVFASEAGQKVTRLAN